MLDMGVGAWLVGRLNGSWVMSNTGKSISPASVMELGYFF